MRRWLHFFEGNHEKLLCALIWAEDLRCFMFPKNWNCIELYWAVLSCIELHSSALNCIESHWAFVCIELYWIALSCIELYWVLEIHRRTRTVQNMGVFNVFSNCIELYWAAFVCIELYWIALSCIELYWVLEIHRRARTVQNISVFTNCSDLRNHYIYRLRCVVGFISSKETMKNCCVRWFEPRI